MQLTFHLRNVEGNATTKMLTKVVQQHVPSFEGRGLRPNSVTIDVPLYLDGLDVPGRDTIVITGGPRLVADYSAVEQETWPTFQQAWQMGRLTVDLDRRFSRSANVLAQLFDALQPIDASVYAIAQALGRMEAKVEFMWFGLFETQAPHPSQIRVRLESRLMARDNKIRLVPPERKMEVSQWEA